MWDRIKNNLHQAFYKTAEQRRYNLSSGIGKEMCWQDTYEKWASSPCRTWRGRVYRSTKTEVRHKTQNKETHWKPTYRHNSQVPPRNQHPSLLHTSHPTDRKIKIYSLKKLRKDMAFIIPGTVMTTEAKELSKTLKY